MERAARMGAARAERRRFRIAGRLREASVPGATVMVEDDQVVLTGRGLGRRLSLDAELRWLMAESRDDE